MSRSGVLLALSVCLAFSVSLVMADSEAILILQKTVHTEYNVVAPDVNYTIELEVFNVGDGVAYEVKVRDDWPATYFNILEGETTHSWNEIAAGAHESYNITMAAKQEGEVSGFRATVEYQPTLEGPIQIGYSTAMRNLTIIPAHHYAKATAKHYQEWSVFAILSVGVVFGPLAYYYLLQTTHTDGIPNSYFKGKKSE